MVCSKCKDVGHYNEVMGKGFYYCRTCKDEIKLEAGKTVDGAIHVGGWKGPPLLNAALSGHNWATMPASSTLVCLYCGMYKDEYDKNPKLCTATLFSFVTSAGNNTQIDPDDLDKLLKGIP